MWLFVVFIECYLLLWCSVSPCTIAFHLYVDLFPDSPLTEYIGVYCGQKSNLFISIEM